MLLSRPIEIVVHVCLHVAFAAFRNTGRKKGTFCAFEVDSHLVMLTVAFFIIKIAGKCADGHLDVPGAVCIAQLVMVVVIGAGRVVILDKFFQLGLDRLLLMLVKLVGLVLLVL